MPPSNPVFFLRRLSLAQWMLFAAGGGVVFGLAAPELAVHLKFISDIFLRLIRAIIAPVLFGVLVRAVGGVGGMKDLGRLGWKSLVFFEVATTLALLLGWFTAAIFRPGDNVALAAQAAPVVSKMTFTDVLVNAFPTSIVDAMARGDVLQIVVFCFLFGVACLAVGERAKPVLVLADAVVAVAFRFTQIIMYLAPAAVFAAMAGTVATSGVGVLLGLARLFGAAWGAELLFLAVIFGGSLVASGVPMRRFVHFVREPFLIAFSTTSSAAALPQTLENMERFGVPNRILGVVAPLSLSLNLCGSTLFLGLATLFVAQAANVPLSFDQQLLILLTLKLTSKGVAGIPRANFVVLTALFQSFGLPLEGLGLLLGIDALIDPIRTSVNVVGHCTAPAVVARWEGVTFPKDLEPVPTMAPPS
ncbi:MAG: dicarboxylate/amino acid:cation symporter [Verrucomicrobia bacterium]|nr:dicarboxylate/amino acid:cation symporter [Verrucomicrobiota bacterium]